MKRFFTFIGVLIILYFILSLPIMLGIGVAIDFVSGASWFSKAKVYFITAIEYGYKTKLIFSIIFAFLLTTILKIKREDA